MISAVTGLAQLVVGVEEEASRIEDTEVAQAWKVWGGGRLGAKLTSGGGGGAS